MRTTFVLHAYGMKPLAFGDSARPHNPKGRNGDHTELTAIPSGLTGVIVWLSRIPFGVRQRSVGALNRFQRVVPPNVQPETIRICCANQTGEAPHILVTLGKEQRGVPAGAVVAGVVWILSAVQTVTSPASASALVEVGEADARVS